MWSRAVQESRPWGTNTTLLQCLSWPRYPREPHYPEKMPSSPKVYILYFIQFTCAWKEASNWTRSMRNPAAPPCSHFPAPRGQPLPVLYWFFSHSPPLLREHAGTTTSSIFHAGISWQLPEVEDVSPIHSATPPATPSSIRRQPGLDTRVDIYILVTT